jgi:hypothetical protein
MQGNEKLVATKEKKERTLKIGGFDNHGFRS